VNDPPYGEAVTSIAVAYDGTEESELALGTAAMLAAFLRVDLTLMAVEEPPGRGRGRDVAGSLTRAVVRLERRPGQAVTARVLRGNAAEELVAACPEHTGLLVLGSRPAGRPATVVAGSVAGYVADHAPCPVLVVPRSAGERESVRRAAV
jgi:nucleotide-binding universal stress UspA family protein